MLHSKKTAAVIGYLTIGMNLIYSLLFTPWILRTLGQSEYGVYTLCTSIISNLSLLQFGFGTTFIRYYIKYNAENRRRKAEEVSGMFAEIFAIIAAVTLVMGAILIGNIRTVLGSRITPDEYQITSILLKIMVFSTVVTVTGVPFQALVTAHEEFVFQKLLSFFEILLKIAVLPALLLSGYRSVAIVAVGAVLSLVTLSANVLFVCKTLRVRFRFSNFDFSLFREMGIFSFFVFLQSVIDMLNWQIDRFLLARFWGSAEIAVYSIGAQINSIFLSISTMFTNLLVPKVNQMVAENRGDSVLTGLLVRAGRIQFLISSFLLSAFVFFGRSFIFFFAGDGYQNAYSVAIFLMAPLLLPLSMDLFTHIARAKGLHKSSTAIFAFVALLNSLISIPLSKYYGEVGAALGTCIGMFIAKNVIQIWYAKKILNLDMIDWAKNLLSLLPSLFLPIGVGIVILFITIDKVSVFITIATGYTILSMCSFWFFGLNKYEKRFFIKPIQKLLHIFRR